MNFDDIRSYYDSEIPAVMERMAGNKQFVNLLSTLFPLMPKDIIRQQLRSVKTTDEFQQRFAYPYLKSVESERTRGITFRGVDTLDKTRPYLYISNHRDITMDAVLLCLIMLDHGMKTVGIAIGDNLLIYPWIEDFVRMNRSFVVKRGVNVRQALQASQQLSAYIRHLITDEGRSVWIAQREGRSKDSTDRTQESLLKMLMLSGEGDFVANLEALHICPLTISYEYDPTDYLKAKEFQLKRDNPDYKKQPQDDLDNMATGIMGFRGQVNYTVSGELPADELRHIAAATANPKERLQMLAQAIDRCIHANYAIYNVNRIAYDLLHGEARFAGEYTDGERSDFEQYVSRQVARVDIAQRDSLFLRTKILEMYANPLANYLQAQGL